MLHKKREQTSSVAMGTQEQRRARHSDPGVLWSFLEEAADKTKGRHRSCQKWAKMLSATVCTRDSHRERKHGRGSTLGGEGIRGIMT